MTYTLSNLWLRCFPRGSKFRIRTRVFALLLAMLGLGLAYPAQSQMIVTCDFDTGTPTLTTGQGVPFDQSSGGLTAHFSTANTGFSVQNKSSTFLNLSLFSGNYLYPDAAGGILVIQFSQQLTNLAFNFATAEQTPIENPTPIRLTAFTNSTATPPVGWTTNAGTYFGGNTLPMGLLSFSSATPFNVVTINIEPGGATGFLIDSLTNKVSGGDHYTITTSASPSVGGTTTGDGTYLSGATVTVEATANPGYQFVNWTENGIEVSPLAFYDFTASAFRTLVANFVATYAVTTSASPLVGGSTMGDGNYPAGSTVNVLASANPGYAFVNWTADGTPVSTWANYSFTLNTNRTLVANFAPACTITTSSSSAAAGLAVGGGIYAIGATVNVVATPKTGYDLVNWTEGGTPVSTSVSYSFTASTNRTLVANFIANSSSVTFDFDAGTPTLTNNQPTPFDQTSGGLTAHFSTTNDPAFSVTSDAATGWMLSKFSSNYLAPLVLESVLEIQFSRTVTNLSLTFATFDFQDIVAPTLVRLTAYTNSTGTPAVGTITASGTYSGNDSMPMGVLTFSSSTPFNLVQITMQPTVLGATEFMVDNITVQAAALPEVPILQSSVSAGGPFTDDLTATVDGTQKTIAVPVTAANQFYRLRSTTSTRIVQITTIGSQVVLKYE